MLPLSMLYQLVRCLLGLIAVLVRRDLSKDAERHCCIKAKGVLAVPQSGDAGPSDTLENRNKPGI
jgi:hypothetical protein